MRAVADALRAADRIALVSHRDPDPDTIGSALALGLALERMGKRVSWHCADPVPDAIRFLASAERYTQAPPPADVLFFAVRDGVSTAVLEPRAQALVNGLARLSPCTVSQWLWVSKHWGREDFVQFCRDLAEMGLVAFG